MKSTVYIFLIIFILAINSILYSQPTEQQKKANSYLRIEDIIKFQAIPSDPVFDLLDLNETQIDKPGTIQKLLTSVKQTTGVNGKLITGIGLTFAPYQIFAGDSITLYKYINSNWERIKSNFQISFGTSPSKNADSSLNWGLGIRIQFLNSGDGRLDTNQYTKMGEIASKILDDEKSKLPEEGETVTPEEMRRRKLRFEELVKLQNDSAIYGAVEELKKDAKGDDPDWNATSLAVNLGVVLKSTDSKIQKSGLDKFRAWVNGGIGGSSWFQGLAQFGVFKFDSVKNWKFSGAIMTRFGSEHFRLGFGASSTDFQTGKGVLGLAGEVQISNSTWIVFSINRELEKGVTSTWNPTAGIKANLAYIPILN